MKHLFIALCLLIIGEYAFSQATPVSASDSTWYILNWWTGKHNLVRKGSADLANAIEYLTYETIIEIPQNQFELAATKPILLIDSSIYSYTSFSIEIVSITSFLDYNTTPYPDNRDIIITYGNNSASNVFQLSKYRCFCAATSDTIGYFSQNSDCVSYDKASIYMQMDEDMSDTSGDSPVTVRVQYNLIIWEE